MNYKETARLCIGDLVRFIPDNATGTITEMNDFRVRIKWNDNGKHSIIHRRDMEDVELTPDATKKIRERLSGLPWL